MKNRVLRFLALVLLLSGLLLAAWTWLALHWSYSDGERAGYVQKLSRKGWLCKTWEGEIAMVTMPGAIPEKFDFTVRDERVAQQINDLAGKRVVLQYRQHRFLPTNCLGETEYFIDGVREVVETPVAPGASLPPLSLPVPLQGTLPEAR